MEINSITYTCTRGLNAGKTLRPHRMKDGSYVVSTSRFAKDYQRVTTAEEIIAALRQGLSLRMSAAPGQPASLISAEKILAENPALTSR